MKTLIANWKTNPKTLQEATALFEGTKADNVIICPPAIYLGVLKATGAQDAFWEGGPHTGQVSTTMLKQFGVKYVLVGHSERRALGETDEQINKKIVALLKENMTPVLLIGEAENNPAIRQDILIDQITRDLEGVSADDALKILYVFEPAWAISTTSGNKAESVDQILAGIQMMRDILQKMYQKDAKEFSMLYGASVNGENCKEILSRPELQGAVVGGASLRAEEFKKMAETTATL